MRCQPDVTTVDYADAQLADETSRRTRDKWQTQLLWLFANLLICIAFAVPLLLLPSGTGTSYTRYTKTAAMVGIYGTISQQIELFAFDFGRLPTCLDELIHPPSEGGPDSSRKAPYIRDESALRDPWGNALRYRAPGSHRTASFDLWSAGPDSQDDTPDDISNWASPPQLRP